MLPATVSWCARGARIELASRSVGRTPRQCVPYPPFNYGKRDPNLLCSFPGSVLSFAAPRCCRRPTRKRADVSRRSGGCKLKIVVTDPQTRRLVRSGAQTVLGAIAVGHPIAATGRVLTVKASADLHGTGGRHGSRSCASAAVKVSQPSTSRSNLQSWHGGAPLRRRCERTPRKAMIADAR
jgi:hypothetical protein